MRTARAARDGYLTSGGFEPTRKICFERFLKILPGAGLSTQSPQYQSAIVVGDAVTRICLDRPVQGG
jgi:hypothetical protein